MFAVRITRDFDQLRPFFDRVKLHPQSVCIVFQHDSDEDVSRTHVHAMISANVGSTDTLKRWVKDAVGPVDRYDWSFTRCREEDKYITYMSKGKLDPCLVHGIEYEKVTALRGSWVEPQVVTNPEKGKREDVTSYSMAKELAKWIDANAFRKKIYQDKFQKILIDDDLTEDEIIRQCVKIHTKYEKSFCDFSLIRVIQTAYGICSHERWNDALVRKVAEKLSPRIV